MVDGILPYVIHLGNLAGASLLAAGEAAPEEVMSAVVDGVSVFIPLDDLLDYPAELARLSKEQERLEADIARLTAKLENPGFVGKAPAPVVAAEQSKRDKQAETLDKIRERRAIVERKLKG